MTEFGPQTFEDFIIAADLLTHDARLFVDKPETYAFASALTEAKKYLDKAYEHWRKHYTVGGY